MRGRKPKTIEQRIAEGNPGHRPLPDTIMIGGRPVPAELASAPDHLGADAKAWWGENVPMMADSGLLNRIDRVQLEHLATCYDDWIKARRVVAVDGHFTRGSVGQLREHPALKIAREAVTQYDRLAEHFGLNPMSRSRLGLAQLKGASLAHELERDLAGDFIDGKAHPPDGDVGLPGI